MSARNAMHGFQPGFPWEPVSTGSVEWCESSWELALLGRYEHGLFTLKCS